MAELNGKKIIFSPRVIMQEGGGGGYVLPVASANTLGGVKIGDNLTIDANGVLSSYKKPVYILYYYDEPTNAQIQANMAVLQAIDGLSPETYDLYIKDGKFYAYAFASKRSSTMRARAYIASDDTKETIRLYEIRSGSAISTYGQSIEEYPLPETVDFDATSDRPASQLVINDELNSRLSGKQDTLTAGSGISISAQNVISATGGGGGTTYTAGAGIDITNDEISLDSTTQAAITSISGKQNIPAQVATGTNITLADNTEYRLTSVTSLTLAFPSGNFECWMKLSFASSGTISVTFPQSASYIGTAPTFANGETWEVSIKDGVIVAAKVTA